MVENIRPDLDDLKFWANLTTRDVIEQALYTSDAMFGEIRYMANEELKRRFPPPDWAKGKL